TSVSLTPASGGILLDVELDRVAIAMHLQYAVACLDDTSDIAVSASHIKVTGLLSVGISRGAFDVRLVDPTVQVTGFGVHLGGLPGKIVDLLHVDSALGTIIGWATEKFAVPILNSSLTALNDTRTVNVLGTPVDVQVTPEQIRFDVTGAVIDIDAVLRARG